MKKLKFLFLLLFLGLFLTGQTQAQFTDLDSEYPYQSAIEYVKKNGIVSGYPDGTFRPESEINRAELTKIITQAVFDPGEINRCTKSYYDDAPAGEWFSPYICIATREGFVEGYPDGSFRPSQSISFVEGAKIISAGFGKTVSYSIPEQDGQGLWYQPYTQWLAQYNAIPVTVAHFSYSLRRGDMAEIIYRLHAGNTSKKSLTYEDLRTVNQAIIDDRFPTKLVYDRNYSQNVMETDCQNRQGKFNTCGSQCSPDAQVCAQVCAYTCDLFPDTDQRRDNMILARFEEKLVYNPSYSQNQLIGDCRNRDGEFNACGTQCRPDADMCVRGCAYTCDLTPEAQMVDQKFDHKIVYHDDFSVDILRRDCASRAGIFNRCGTGCSPDANFCTQDCRYTCQLNRKEAIIDKVFNNKIVYHDQYSLNLLRQDCTNRDGNFNKCGTGCAPDVNICAETCRYVCDLEQEAMIEARYENKIVYNQERSESVLRQDCQDRGGDFNDCGNGCRPEADFCAQMCVFTCDLNIPDEDFITAHYDTKIVYDPQYQNATLENDCETRGGIFDSCGSGCAPDADFCTTQCVPVCQMEDLVLSRITSGSDVILSYDRQFATDTVRQDCQERGGEYIAGSNNCELRNMIRENFSTKLVYQGDYTDGQLRSDCLYRGGDFDTCGNGCAPGVDVCAQSCVRVCQL